MKLRRLATARPDAFLPDLVMSLNNTGAMLSDLGRREEALAASQEAVDIRRRLAATRPGPPFSRYRTMNRCLDTDFGLTSALL